MNTIVMMRNDAGSGAGSRGGHIIGRTKSGKPIYMGKKPGTTFGKNIHIHTEPDKFADQHIHWNASDHKEAARLCHPMPRYFLARQKYKSCIKNWRRVKLQNDRDTGHHTRA